VGSGEPDSFSFHLGVKDKGKFILSRKLEKEVVFSIDGGIRCGVLTTVIKKV
jgi:hypothetical protein